MNDVIDRLARLDGTAPSPSESVVAGDLARAHAALGRRRRTRAALAGAGLTLGVGATLAVVAVVSHDDADMPMATPPPSDTGRERDRVELISYTGAQPEGFLLAKVPAGFEIQGSDQFVLTLAEPDDSSHYLSFVGKVVVTLESQDAGGRVPDGVEVTVDGEPGVLYDSPEGLARYLRYQDGKHTMLIQAWRTVGLTDDQLVELAEAVTVTGDVQAPVG